MVDRSGRGPAETEAVVAELQQLRRSLARQRRTDESVEEHRKIAQDLEAIQTGLRRLAQELEELPQFDSR